MSSELFNRLVEVNVNGPLVLFMASNRDNPSFEIEFDITRSLDDDPNTATVTLYNLDGVDAGALAAIGSDSEAQAKHIIEINAGYMGQDMEDPDPLPNLLFRGVVGRAITRLEDNTYITEIEATDGDVQKKQKPANKKKEKVKRRSYGNNARAETIARELLEELGINGSIDSVKQRKKVYKKGYIAQGHAYEAFKKLLDSLNLEFSIQNGEAQILEVGGNTGIEQPVDYKTGLIGNTIRRDTGVVECSTLILPNIVPGALISLGLNSLSDPMERALAVFTGSSLSGEPTFAIKEENIEAYRLLFNLQKGSKYRIERASYKGNSRSGDFSINIEASAAK